VVLSLDPAGGGRAGKGAGTHRTAEAEVSGGAGVSLDGHIYRVTDREAFFLPVIAGGPPTEGYKPWADVEVLPWVVDPLLPIPLPGSPAMTHSDGSFSIPQPLPIPGLGDASDVRLGLRVNEGSLPYRPLYRSDLALTVDEAQSVELNIWLYPDTIEEKDGVAAGTVSKVVKGAGLPGNTTISASPSGLSFSGSRDGADIEFGISIRPDTSFDLGSFLDLMLASWNIDVGWPADWCTDAEDILVEIIKGLQGAGASMNGVALARMEALFEEQAKLPEKSGPKIAKEFFAKDVAVTFMDVKYPTKHSWGISNTSDQTIVVTADPCIGYPRHLTSDPNKRPPIKPVQLSRRLRPVLV
jgi:hypothetical protein